MVLLSHTDGTHKTGLFLRARCALGSPCTHWVVLTLEKVQRWGRQSTQGPAGLCSVLRGCVSGAQQETDKGHLGQVLPRVWETGSRSQCVKLAPNRVWSGVVWGVAASWGPAVWVKLGPSPRACWGQQTLPCCAREPWPWMC